MSVRESYSTVKHSEHSNLNEIPIQHVGLVEHSDNGIFYERIIAGEKMPDKLRQTFINDDDMSGIIPLHEYSITGSLGFADFIVGLENAIPSMTIAYLGVEPRFRKIGVARALACELDKIARSLKIKRVEASVAFLNKDNIFPLLQEFGFRIENQTALSCLMIKELE